MGCVCPVAAAYLRSAWKGRGGCARDLKLYCAWGALHCRGKADRQPLLRTISQQGRIPHEFIRQPFDSIHQARRAGKKTNDVRGWKVIVAGAVKLQLDKFADQLYLRR